MFDQCVALYFSTNNIFGEYVLNPKNVIEHDILALEFSAPKIKPGMAYVEEWHVNLVGVKKPVEPIKFHTK